MCDSQSISSWRCSPQEIPVCITISRSPLLPPPSPSCLGSPPPSTTGMRGASASSAPSFRRGNSPVRFESAWWKAGGGGKPRCQMNQICQPRATRTSARARASGRRYERAHECATFPLMAGGLHAREGVRRNRGTSNSFPEPANLHAPDMRSACRGTRPGQSSTDIILRLRPNEFSYIFLRNAHRGVR